jgi:hypothetical protein
MSSSPDELSIDTVTVTAVYMKSLNILIYNTILYTGSIIISSDHAKTKISPTSSISDATRKRLAELPGVLFPGLQWPICGGLVT